MQTARRWWGVLAGCACLASGSFALIRLRAEPPSAQDGADPNGFVVSVLQREDAVFASTDIGLCRAALSDKAWHKLPLPSSAPTWGNLAREAAPSPLLVYYTGRHGVQDRTDQAAAFYVSGDLGQTWERTSAGRNFGDVFTQSDGSLYADELMQTSYPPLRGDRRSTMQTTNPEAGLCTSGIAWTRTGGRIFSAP